MPGKIQWKCLFVPGYGSAEGRLKAYAGYLRVITWRGPLPDSFGPEWHVELRAASCCILGGGDTAAGRSIM